LKGGGWNGSFYWGIGLLVQRFTEQQQQQQQ
jgi:hypothetical protein